MIFPYAPPLVSQSPPLQVIIAQSLDDVEEGGETAFLIADNTTTTADVIIKIFENDDRFFNGDIDKMVKNQH